MTWTATQPELPSRMAADDLSEAAALAHFCAIAWVQAVERFDCVIPRRLLAAALPLTHDVAAVETELSAAGYWRSHDKSVELVDHAGFTQRSLMRVEKKRRTDADASRRYRQKGRTSPPSAADAATDTATGTATGTATDTVTESGSDAAPESDSEHAPRLPTYQANYRSRRGALDEQAPPDSLWPRVAAGYDN